MAYFADPKYGPAGDATLSAAPNTPNDYVAGTFAALARHLGMDEHSAYRLGRHLTGVAGFTPLGIPGQLHEGGKLLGEGANHAMEGEYASGAKLGGLGIASLAAALAPGLNIGKEAEKTAVEEAASRVAQLGDHPTTTAARIINQTKKNGGYSVNLPTGDLPKDGLMMGMYANADPRNTVIEPGMLNRAAVTGHAEKNAKALNALDNYFGSWIDPDSQKTYLDVSKRFPPNDIRVATKYGERTGQLAGYDVGKGESFPVGNWREYIKSPDFIARLQEMEKVGNDYLKQFPTKEWWDMHGGPFERVYGAENLPNLAGYIASTAPGTAPRPNLQTASEYMRRHIMGEPIIQPDWRVPPGQMTRNAGTKIGMETGRAANLIKSSKGDLNALQKDKVREEALALMGNPDAFVADRHWVRLSEDPSKGVYAGTQEGAIGPGDSYSALKKSIQAYTDAANKGLPKEQQRSIRDRSADIWTGIRETIKNKSELFGQKFKGSAIQGDSKSYADQFEDLIREKAKHLDITPAEMEKRLRNGSETLLSLLVAGSPLGMALFNSAVAGSKEKREEKGAEALEQSHDILKEGARPLQATF